MNAIDSWIDNIKGTFFLDPAVRYQKLAGHDLKIIASNPSGDRNYYLRNKHANLLNHYKNNYYFLEGVIC